MKRSALLPLILLGMAGIVQPAQAQSPEKITLVQRDIKPIDPAFFIPNRFKGRTILMTGAATGIGRATAIRAAREGANVVVADLKDKEGNETVKIISDAGGKAIFVHTDVRKNEDCQRMVDVTVKAFGKMDGVLNAAGVMDAVPPGKEFDLATDRKLLFAPIHEATDEYWDDCFAVNVTGMFKSMRFQLRQMLKQNNGGSIVNIGSIAGLIGLGGSPAYNASKHAVTGLTRNAAIDYAPMGIRVNSVNMAATETPMTDQAFKKVLAIQKEAAAKPSAKKLPDTSMAKTASLLAIADTKHQIGRAHV